MLNYTEKALASPVNTNKFIIWYYKAAAECLLNKLPECHESARMASSLASPQGEAYVHEIFKISELMSSGTIKTTADKYGIKVDFVKPGEDQD